MRQGIHERLCVVESKLGITTDACEPRSNTYTRGRFTVFKQPKNPLSKMVPTKKQFKNILSKMAPNYKAGRFKVLSGPLWLQKSLEDSKRHLDSLTPKNVYPNSTRNRKLDVRYDNKRTGSS